MSNIHRFFNPSYVAEYEKRWPYEVVVHGVNDARIKEILEWVEEREDLHKYYADAEPSKKLNRDDLYLWFENRSTALQCKLVWGGT